MHKTIIFAFAGLGVILAGCNAGSHRYQTIPVDDPAATQYPVAQQPVRQPRPRVEKSELTVENTPTTPAPRETTVRKYAPMTGAVSSGGVDKVPGKKTTVKKAAPRSTESKVIGDGKATVHTVKRGEYPGLIAKRYGITTSALLEANNLTLESSKKLQVGHKLNIPARSAVAATKKSSAKTQSLQDPGPGKHRIKPGETPDVIARRYKVKLDELMAVNNLTEETARRLQVNQVLIIPGKAQAPTAAVVDNNTAVQPTVAPAVAPAAENTAAESAQPKTDSAPAVSESPEDVLLMETTLLDVMEDTTYAKVAAEYGISENALRALNGGAADDTIAKGTMLTVPKK